MWKSALIFRTGVVLKSKRSEPDGSEEVGTIMPLHAHIEARARFEEIQEAYTAPSLQECTLVR